MSTSKLMELAQKENLPYIFSQKKVESFKFEGNPVQAKNSLKMKEWALNWWQNPKHGLLYQLNDGSLGFKFNDNTTIIGHPFPQKLTFINSEGKK